MAINGVDNTQAYKKLVDILEDIKKYLNSKI